MWRRFAAMLIDALLVVMLQAGGLLVWTVVAGKAPTWGSDMANAYLAGTLFVALVVMIILDSGNQGTPGMLVMDCRIIDARSGLRMNLGQSLRRWAAMPLSILPGLLGVLWIGWDRRKQGFHDKLAGTVVIREDEAFKTLSELARESR